MQYRDRAPCRPTVLATDDGDPTLTRYRRIVFTIAK